MNYKELQQQFQLTASYTKYIDNSLISKHFNIPPSYIPKKMLILKDI
jgi:hypothetical protein